MTLNTTSLFSESYRLEKLSKQGDPLERLNKVVEWEYLLIESKSFRY